MTDWTGTQIENAERRLEQASAGVLGRMLFEFARLDVALGLFLVWSGEGRHIDKLTKTVGEYTFHKRLDFLKELAENHYPSNSEAHALYAKWLTDAHTTRTRRNELVHGRWGIDPIRGQVLNVVGLPTSSEQREMRYTIPDLEGTLAEMKALQYRLHTLRTQWPL